MEKSFEEREDEIRRNIAKTEKYIETEDLPFEQYMSGLDHLIVLRDQLMDLYKEWEGHDSITG